jgi:hypothetical protein
MSGFQVSVTTVFSCQTVLEENRHICTDSFTARNVLLYVRTHSFRQGDNSAKSSSISLPRTPLDVKTLRNAVTLVADMAGNPTKNSRFPCLTGGEEEPG